MSIRHINIFCPPLSILGDFHLGRAIPLILIDVQVRYNIFKLRFGPTHHDRFIINVFDKSFNIFCRGFESISNTWSRNGLDVSKMVKSLIKAYQANRVFLNLLPDGEYSWQKETVLVVKKLEFRDDMKLFGETVNNAILDLYQKGILTLGIRNHKPNLFLNTSFLFRVSGFHDCLDSIITYPVRCRKEMMTRIDSIEHTSYCEKFPILIWKKYGIKLANNIASDFGIVTRVSREDTSPTIASLFAFLFIPAFFQKISGDSVIDFMPSSITNLTRYNLMSLVTIYALNKNCAQRSIIFYGKLGLPSNVPLKKFYGSKAYPDSIRFLIIDQLSERTKVFSEDGLSFFQDGTIVPRKYIRCQYQLCLLRTLFPAEDIVNQERFAGVVSYTWLSQFSDTMEQCDFRKAFLILIKELDRLYALRSSTNNKKLKEEINLLLDAFRIFLPKT